MYDFFIIFFQFVPSQGIKPMTLVAASCYQLSCLYKWLSLKSVQGTQSHTAFLAMKYPTCCKAHWVTCTQTHIHSGIHKPKLIDTQKLCAWLQLCCFSTLGYILQIPQDGLSTHTHITPVNRVHTHTQTYNPTCTKECKVWLTAVPSTP